MKYLALIYGPSDPSPDYESPEFAALIKKYQEAEIAFEKAGVMLAGEALQSPTTATTVSVRNGKAETIDGPFAETKEELGGFYLFDCDNLDDAIKYAAMIPSAEFGSIEVRPIMEIPG